MKYIIFEGTLTTHYETGMEFLGLGVNSDNPIWQTPNPKFNKDDPNCKEIEFFLSYESLTLLKKNDRVEITDPEGNVLVYNIGNRSLQREHEFRFGDAYPIEINTKEDVHEFALMFHRGYKGRIIRPIKKVAFYGGTFDPLHNGHKEVIKNLHYSYDEVVILPTNNYLKKNFLFPIKQRIKAAQGLANHLNNVRVLDWSLYEDTSKTYEMFLKLQKEYGIDPHIVIGSDNLENIEKWQNFDKLKSCPFIVFPRGEIDRSNVKLENCQIMTYSHNIIKTSSTEIKAKKLVDLIPLECREFYNLELLTKEQK